MHPQFYDGSEADLMPMFRAIPPQVWRGWSSDQVSPYDFTPRLAAADLLDELGRSDEAAVLRDTRKHAYLTQNNGVQDAHELSQRINRKGSSGALSWPDIRQYIETALWSSRDDDDVPLDLNHGASHIHPDTLAAMIADAHHFYAMNHDEYLDSPASESDFGHNFWLSRNGYGAGFFDSPDMWGEHTDALQQAAKSHGEYDLYVGDDGMIHGTYEVSPTPPAADTEPPPEHDPNTPFPQDNVTGYMDGTFNESFTAPANYDADESTIVAYLKLLQKEEHNHTRWATPNQADMNLRLTMADAFQDMGREQEAQLLRDPNRHVVVQDGQVLPGRFTARPAFQAHVDFLNQANDFSGGDYPYPEIDVLAPGNGGQYRAEDFHHPDEYAVPIPSGHFRVVDIDPGGYDYHNHVDVHASELPNQLFGQTSDHHDLFSDFDFQDDENEILEQMLSDIQHAPFEEVDADAMNAPTDRQDNARYSRTDYSHEAFQKNARENPQDDTNWLVYADYLDENGMSPQADRVRWWMGARAHLRDNVPEDAKARSAFIPQEWVRKLLGSEVYRNLHSRVPTPHPHDAVVEDGRHTSDLFQMGILPTNEWAHRMEESVRALRSSDSTPHRDSHSHALSGDMMGWVPTAVAHSMTDDPNDQEDLRYQFRAYGGAMQQALRSYMEQNPPPEGEASPDQNPSEQLSRYSRIDYSHKAFVNAIRKEPTNSNPRAVFADWLEENDPNADPETVDFLRHHQGPAWIHHDPYTNQIWSGPKLTLDDIRAANGEHFRTENPVPGQATGTMNFGLLPFWEDQEGLMMGMQATPTGHVYSGPGGHYITVQHDFPDYELNPDPNTPPNTGYSVYRFHPDTGALEEHAFHWYPDDSHEYAKNASIFGFPSQRPYVGEDPDDQVISDDVDGYGGIPPLDLDDPEQLSRYEAGIVDPPKRMPRTRPTFPQSPRMEHGAIYEDGIDYDYTPVSEFNPEEHGDFWDWASQNAPEGKFDAEGNLIDDVDSPDEQEGWWQEARSLPDSAWGMQPTQPNDHPAMGWLSPDFAQPRQPGTQRTSSPTSTQPERPSWWFDPLPDDPSEVDWKPGMQPPGTQNTTTSGPGWELVGDAPTGPSGLVHPHRSVSETEGGIFDYKPVGTKAQPPGLGREQSGQGTTDPYSDSSIRQWFQGLDHETQQALVDGLRSGRSGQHFDDTARSVPGLQPGFWSEIHGKIDENPSFVRDVLGYPYARYSRLDYAHSRDLLALFKAARENPYEDTVHGMLADALDEEHPGHPVTDLIRRRYGMGIPRDESLENHYYPETENSWDGTFPYTARLGQHGPFDIYLGHEGGPEQHQKWIVHAVARINERRPHLNDFGYTFEFPHEQAHLIPQMFPAAGEYIDKIDRRSSSWSPMQDRRDEAERFSDRMDEEERNRDDYARYDHLGDEGIPAEFPHSAWEDEAITPEHTEYVHSDNRPDSHRHPLSGFYPVHVGSVFHTRTDPNGLRTVIADEGEDYPVQAHVLDDYTGDLVHETPGFGTPEELWRHLVQVGAITRPHAEPPELDDLDLQSIQNARQSHYECDYGDNAPETSSGTDAWTSPYPSHAGRLKTKRLSVPKSHTQYGLGDERRGFETAISANPHDGTSHAVFADWLDENGQAEEGAFHRALGGWLAEDHEWTPFNERTSPFGVVPVQGRPLQPRNYRTYVPFGLPLERAENEDPVWGGSEGDDWLLSHSIWRRGLPGTMVGMWEKNLPEWATREGIELPRVIDDHSRPGVLLWESPAHMKLDLRHAWDASQSLPPNSSVAVPDEIDHNQTNLSRYGLTEYADPPFPSHQMHPDFRFTRLGAYLRKHANEQNDVGALARGALTHPHDQPAELHYLHLLRDLLMPGGEYEDHPLANDFNWNTLPETFRFDQELRRLAKREYVYGGLPKEVYPEGHYIHTREPSWQDYNEIADVASGYRDRDRYSSAGDVVSQMQRLYPHTVDSFLPIFDSAHRSGRASMHASDVSREIEDADSLHDRMSAFPGLDDEGITIPQDDPYRYTDDDDGPVPNVPEFTWTSPNPEDDIDYPDDVGVYSPQDLEHMPTDDLHLLHQQILDHFDAAFAPQYEAWTWPDAAAVYPNYHDSYMNVMAEAARRGIQLPHPERDEGDYDDGMGIDGDYLEGDDPDDDEEGWYARVNYAGRLRGSNETQTYLDAIRTARSAWQSSWGKQSFPSDELLAAARHLEQAGDPRGEIVQKHADMMDGFLDDDPVFSHVSSTRDSRPLGNVPIPLPDGTNLRIEGHGHHEYPGVHAVTFAWEPTNEDRFAGHYDPNEARRLADRFGETHPEVGQQIHDAMDEMEGRAENHNYARVSYADPDGPRRDLPEFVVGVPEPEPEEPEEWVEDEFPQDEGIQEGDLVTTDHQNWYMDGRLVLTVPEGEDHGPHIRAWMNREGWFPNVWFVSDHGNEHPVDYGRVDYADDDTPDYSAPQHENAGDKFHKRVWNTSHMPGYTHQGFVLVPQPTPDGGAIWVMEDGQPHPIQDHHELHSWIRGGHFVPGLFGGVDLGQHDLRDSIMQPLDTDEFYRSGLGGVNPGVGMHPDDANARVVYADWLDEQGHTNEWGEPLGEDVRKEARWVMNRVRDEGPTPDHVLPPKFRSPGLLGPDDIDHNQTNLSRYADGDESGGWGAPAEDPGYDTDPRERERQGFLTAIHANPMDATSHLVMADWHDEQGEPDEAAFRRSMGAWVQGLGEKGMNVDLRQSLHAREWVYPHDYPAYGLGGVMGLPEGVKRWGTAWGDMDIPVNPNTGYFDHTSPEEHHPNGSFADLFPSITAPYHFRWGTYAGMEENLRRAFMSNLKRQRGEV